MKRISGFTLVELLVVIAIISILAAIVVPRVTDYMSRAKRARAEAEINSIGLALTGVLTDAGKKDFRQIFMSSAISSMDNILCGYGSPDPDALDGTVAEYTDWMYKLLRNGRAAEVPLRPEVRRRLSDGYLDLANDPWGNIYQFYPTPLSAVSCYRSQELDPPFRIYRPSDNIPGGPDYDGTIAAVNDEGDRIGWFPKKNLPVYVWSRGEDLLSNQPGLEDYLEGAQDPIYRGGGDDINNWDTDQSWSGFYS
jgi:prepilin-type N-terminal cleavage/methylation domain-containing protein